MGRALDRMRERASRRGDPNCVEFAIWIPPHPSHDAEGKLVMVKGYWRRGTPARPQFPAPQHVAVPRASVQRAVAKPTAASERVKPSPPTYEKPKLKDSHEAFAAVDEARAFVATKMGSDVYSSPNWALAIGHAAMRNELKAYQAQLAQVADWKVPSQISKADKIKIARERSKLETLIRASRLAARLSTGNIAPDEIESELAYLEDRMSQTKAPKVFGNDYPIWPAGLYEQLRVSGDKTVYTLKKAELPFDLDKQMITHAPDAQDIHAMREYINSTTDKLTPEMVTLMSHQQLTDWIRYEIGDPALADEQGGHWNTQDEITKVIKKEYAFAEVHSIAEKAFAMHPEAIGQDVDTTTSEAGDWALKALAMQAMVPDLKAVYSLQGTLGGDAFEGHVTQQDPNDAESLWTMHNNISGSEWPETFVGVLNALADPGMSAVPQTSITAMTPWKQDLASKPSIAKDPAKVVNAWIKAHGGNYLGQMSKVQKGQWILLHLMGFESAKYNMEEGKAASLKGLHFGGTGEHLLKTTHPGSPYSPDGQKARQMLANWVALRPWGGAYNSGESPEAWDNHEVMAFADDFGLTAPAWTEQVQGGKPLTADGARSLLIELWPYFPKPSELPAPTPGLVIESPAEAVPEPTVSKLAVSAAAGLTPQQSFPQDAWQLSQDVDVVASDGNQHPFAVLSPVIDKMSEAEVDAALEQKKAYFGNGLSGIYDAPINIKKLALYAGQHVSDAQQVEPPDGLLKVIQGKLVLGMYAGPPVPGAYGVIQIPGGTGVYMLAKGDKVWQSAPDHLLVEHADGTGVFLLAGKVAEAGTIDQVQQSIATGPWLPYVQKQSVDLPPQPITKALAAQAHKNYSQDEWNLVSKFEMADPGIAVFGVDTSLPESDINILLADHKEVLPEVIANAPLAVKKLMLSSVAQPNNGTADIVDLINFKAKYGGYGIKKVPLWADPSKLYAPYIAKGLVSEDAINGTWSLDMLAQLVVDAGLKVNVNTDTGQAVHAVAEWLKGVTPETPGTPEPVTEAKPKPKKPVLVDEAKTLTFTLMPGEMAKMAAENGLDKGSHSKDIFKDNEGRKWLAKAFPSDPNSKLRVEQEVAASNIGQLFGFGTPPALARTMPMSQGSSYAYLQLMKAPHATDLRTVAPQDLKATQLQQVMEEQLLDWMVSNHDSYGGNLLVDENGDVFGIDKGQAFKGFPNDPLTFDSSWAMSHLSVAHPAYYQSVASAFKSGKINKEQMDAVVIHVLTRAKEIATHNDDEFHALLESAFEHKKSFPAGMDKEKFIQAAMDRKHAVAESFEKLYKDLYADAGVEYTVPPLTQISVDKIENERGSVYTSVSSALLADVHTAQVQGVSAMFNTQDLDDAHMLLWEEQDKEGHPILMAEGRLREDADQRVTQWISEHTVMNDVHGKETKSGVLTSTDPSSVVPKNDVWFDLIVKAAKTVNEHQEDGQYNTGTMSELDTAIAEMQATKQLVDAHLQGKPNKPGAWTYPSGTGSAAIKFTDLNQEQAFAEMVDKYLAYAVEVKDAKEHSAKTYATHPADKFYLKYSYTPPPKPKVVDEWQGGEANELMLKKLDNGEWQLYHSDTGETETVSAAEGAKMAKGFTEAQALDAEVGSKKLVLFKRKNKRLEGALNTTTGVLTQSGGELSSGSPGYEYDIEVGNGDIVLEYQPWHEPGTPLSQQGLIRFRVRNFSGSESQVRSAMAVMQEMGIDLTPADAQGLELFYWRHLTGILANRAGYNDGKNKQVLDFVKQAHQQNPNMTPDEELTMLKKAWTLYLGTQRVAQANWMPQFHHGRLQAPDLLTGKPYWNRPEYTPEEMFDRPLITESLHQGGNEGLAVVMTNGLKSTEERLRTFGQWLTGMSSSEDQKKGSAMYVFTHPSSSYSAHVQISPLVWLRTSNYKYGSDHFGDLAYRKSGADFDLHSVMSTGGHELMVKYDISLLDEIETLSLPSSVRKQAIDALHQVGVTHIRGLPIEDRILEQHDPQRKAKTKAAVMASKQWYLDHKGKALPAMTVESAEPGSAEAALPVPGVVPGVFSIGDVVNIPNHPDMGQGTVTKVGASSVSIKWNEELSQPEVWHKSKVAKVVAQVDPFASAPVQSKMGYDQLQEFTQSLQTQEAAVGWAESHKAETPANTWTQFAAGLVKDGPAASWEFYQQKYFPMLTIPEFQKLFYAIAGQPQVVGPAAEPTAPELEAHLKATGDVGHALGGFGTSLPNMKSLHHDHHVMESQTHAESNVPKIAAEPPNEVDIATDAMVKSALDGKMDQTDWWTTALPNQSNNSKLLSAQTILSTTDKGVTTWLANHGKAGVSIAEAKARANLYLAQNFPANSKYTASVVDKYGVALYWTAFHYQGPAMTGKQLLGNKGAQKAIANLMVTKKTGVVEWTKKTFPGMTVPQMRKLGKVLQKEIGKPAYVGVGADTDAHDVGLMSFNDIVSAAGTAHIAGQSSPVDTWFKEHAKYPDVDMESVSKIMVFGEEGHDQSPAAIDKNAQNYLSSYLGNMIGLDQWKQIAKVMYLEHHVPKKIEDADKIQAIGVKAWMKLHQSSSTFSGLTTSEGGWHWIANQLTGPDSVTAFKELFGESTTLLVATAMGNALKDELSKEPQGTLEDAMGSVLYNVVDPYVANSVDEYTAGAMTGAQLIEGFYQHLFGDLPVQPGMIKTPAEFVAAVEEDIKQADYKLPADTAALYWALTGHLPGDAPISALAPELGGPSPSLIEGHPWEIDNASKTEKLKAVLSWFAHQDPVVNSHFASETKGAGKFTKWVSQLPSAPKAEEYWAPQFGLNHEQWSALMESITAAVGPHGNPANSYLDHTEIQQALDSPFWTYLPVSAGSIYVGGDVVHVGDTVTVAGFLAEGPATVTEIGPDGLHVNFPNKPDLVMVIKPYQIHMVNPPEVTITDAPGSFQPLDLPSEIDAKNVSYSLLQKVQQYKYGVLTATDQDLLVKAFAPSYGGNALDWMKSMAEPSHAGTGASDNAKMVYWALTGELPGGVKPAPKPGVMEKLKQDVASLDVKKFEVGTPVLVVSSPTGELQGKTGWVEEVQPGNIIVTFVGDPTKYGLKPEQLVKATHDHQGLQVVVGDTIEITHGGINVGHSGVVEDIKGNGEDVLVLMDSVWYPGGTFKKTASTHHVPGPDGFDEALGSLPEAVGWAEKHGTKTPPDGWTGFAAHYVGQGGLGTSGNAEQIHQSNHLYFKDLLTDEQFDTLIKAMATHLGVKFAPTKAKLPPEIDVNDVDASVIAAIAQHQAGTMTNEQLFTAFKDTSVFKGSEVSVEKWMSGVESNAAAGIKMNANVEATYWAITGLLPGENAGAPSPQVTLPEGVHVDSGKAGDLVMSAIAQHHAGKLSDQELLDVYWNAAGMDAPQLDSWLSSAHNVGSDHGSVGAVYWEITGVLPSEDATSLNDVLKYVPEYGPKWESGPAPLLGGTGGAINWMKKHQKPGYATIDDWGKWADKQVADIGDVKYHWAQTGQSFDPPLNAAQMEAMAHKAMQEYNAGGPWNVDMVLQQLGSEAPGLQGSDVQDIADYKNGLTSESELLMLVPGVPHGGAGEFKAWYETNLNPTSLQTAVYWALTGNFFTPTISAKIGEPVPAGGPIPAGASEAFKVNDVVQVPGGDMGVITDVMASSDSGEMFAKVVHGESGVEDNFPFSQLKAQPTSPPPSLPKPWVVNDFVKVKSTGQFGKVANVKAAGYYTVKLHNGLEVDYTEGELMQPGEGDTQVMVSHNSQVQAIVDTQNQAWEYILQHQSQSVDWAMKNDGWDIQEIHHAPSFSPGDTVQVKPDVQGSVIPIYKGEVGHVQDVLDNGNILVEFETSDGPIAVAPEKLEYMTPTPPVTSTPEIVTMWDPEYLKNKTTADDVLEEKLPAKIWLWSNISDDAKKTFGLKMDGTDAGGWQAFADYLAGISLVGGGKWIKKNMPSQFKKAQPSGGVFTSTQLKTIGTKLQKELHAQPSGKWTAGQVQSALPEYVGPSGNVSAGTLDAIAAYKNGEASAEDLVKPIGWADSPKMFMNVMGTAIKNNQQTTADERALYWALNNEGPKDGTPTVVSASSLVDNVLKLYNGSAMQYFEAHKKHSGDFKWAQLADSMSVAKKAAVEAWTKQYLDDNGQQPAEIIHQLMLKLKDEVAQMLGPLQPTADTLPDASGIDGLQTVGYHTDDWFRWVAGEPIFPAVLKEWGSYISADFFNAGQWLEEHSTEHTFELVTPPDVQLMAKRLAKTLEVQDKIDEQKQKPGWTATKYLADVLHAGFPAPDGLDPWATALVDQLGSASDEQLQEWINHHAALKNNFDVETIRGLIRQMSYELHPDDTSFLHGDNPLEWLEHATNLADGAPLPDWTGGEITAMIAQIEDWLAKDDWDLHEEIVESFGASITPAQFRNVVKQAETQLKKMLNMRERVTA